MSSPKVVNTAKSIKRCKSSNTCCISAPNNHVNLHVKKPKNILIKKKKIIQNFILIHSEVSCTFCLVRLTLLKDISPSSS